MIPNYKDYSYEELIDARNHIDCEAYPERVIELDLWIEKKRPQVQAPKTVVWLKRPNSDSHFERYLGVIWLLIFVPLLWIGGPQTPEREVLTRVKGQFIKIEQATKARSSYDRFYIYTTNGNFLGIGKWDALYQIDKEQPLLLSVANDEVWEIASDGHIIVSMDEFQSYARSVGIKNKIFSIAILIFVVMCLKLAYKYYRYEKEIGIKI